MDASSQQLERWTTAFGQEFTDRNDLTPEEMDARYIREYGVARTAMNEMLLADLPRDLRILEVGSNIGNQLRYLQDMHFTNLWGVEAADYALDTARARTTGINLVKGNGFDLPFKDGWFDLVFTSVVLIHISPADLPRMMSEIHRCTRRYIWGLEYLAETPSDVPYQGLADMCWKRDFAREYLERFPDLHLVQQTMFPYVASSNADAMFLLSK